MTTDKDVILDNGRILLRCLNCETYFQVDSVEINKVPLFCSSTCLEEAKLVRKLRRLGKTLFEDKGAVLASISAWFDTILHFKTNESAKINHKDVESIMNAIMGRVRSEIPLKRCDGESDWVKINRQIAIKRARHITQKDPDKVIELILFLKKKGLSYHLIAKELTKEGILTTTGMACWHANTVKSLHESYLEMKTT